MSDTKQTKPRILINPPPDDGRCEGCGVHVSLLKPFGGKGDPLQGDFRGQYLVKNYREECFIGSGQVGASWECRDCILLDDSLFIGAVQKRLDVCPACSYFHSCCRTGESWNEAMARVRERIQHTCVNGGKPEWLEPWDEAKRREILQKTFEGQCRGLLMKNSEHLDKRTKRDYIAMLKRFNDNGFDYFNIGEHEILAEQSKTYSSDKSTNQPQKGE